MKRVAFFDFDNTLIHGDSLMPFLRYATGVLPSNAAIVAAAGALALQKLRGQEAKDARTFFKDFLLRRLLKGKRPQDLQEAAQRTRAWQKINAPVMEKLRAHHAQGDTIVIASGSLDLYLPELLRDIPHDDVICTEIEIQDGLLTGAMTKGNCVRQNKAARIAAWLKDHEGFDESFGYGNYPHDVPMMALLQHRIIVS